jgi:hypothetical protein
MMEPTRPRMGDAILAAAEVFIPYSTRNPGKIMVLMITMSRNFD